MLFESQKSIYLDFFTGSMWSRLSDSFRQPPELQFPLFYPRVTRVSSLP